MKLILTLCFLVSSFSVFAQANLESAQSKLSEGLSTIDKLLDSESIRFTSPRAEREFNKAYRVLVSAGQEVAEVAKNGQPVVSPLDLAIERAQFLKTLMVAYFGEQGFADVYNFKNYDFNLEFSSTKTLEVCILKIPFLSAASGRRSIRVYQRDIIPQFNKIKSEFYNELMNAAAINKNDSRLKTLIEWGAHTRYTFNGSHVGAHEIITFQEVNSLR